MSNGLKGLFVTATDTGVGKTVITAALAVTLSPERVSVWKPVQSGALATDPAGDAALLHAWTGCGLAPETLCTRSFSDPLAPYVAAERANAPIDLGQLVREARQRGHNRLLLVEGAGGVAVPLTDKATVLDFMASLRLPAVIVARPGLGTVNHTLLTVAAIHARGLEVAGVILNPWPDAGSAAATDPSLADNARLIRQFGHVQVLGCFPRLSHINAQTLREAAQANLDLAYLSRVAGA